MATKAELLAQLEELNPEHGLSDRASKAEVEEAIAGSKQPAAGRPRGRNRGRALSLGGMSAER